jgi:hypothetical protein
MLHKFSADQNQHVSGTSESPTGSQKHAAIMQIIQNQVRLTRFSDLLVYIVLIYQYHLPGFSRHRRFRVLLPQLPHVLVTELDAMRQTAGTGVYGTTTT